ncbi:hypothetical protein HDU96_009459, partial [Phlyctochytrium bullatum]
IYDGQLPRTINQKPFIVIPHAKFTSDNFVDSLKDIAAIIGVVSSEDDLVVEDESIHVVIGKGALIGWNGRSVHYARLDGLTSSPHSQARKTNDPTDPINQKRGRFWDDDDDDAATTVRGARCGDGLGDDGDRSGRGSVGVAFVNRVPQCTAASYVGFRYFPDSYAYRPSSGAVVGFVFSAVVFITLVTLLTVWFIHWRRRRYEDEIDEVIVVERGYNAPVAYSQPGMAYTAAPAYTATSYAPPPGPLPATSTGFAGPVYAAQPYQPPPTTVVYK